MMPQVTVMGASLLQMGGLIKVQQSLADGRGKAIPLVHNLLSISSNASFVLESISVSSKILSKKLSAVIAIKISKNLVTLLPQQWSAPMVTNVALNVAISV